MGLGEAEAAALADGDATRVRTFRLILVEPRRPLARQVSANEQARRALCQHRDGAGRYRGAAAEILVPGPTEPRFRSARLGPP